MINSFSSRQNKEFRSKTRGPRLTLVPQPTSISKWVGEPDYTCPGGAREARMQQKQKHRLQGGHLRCLGSPIIIIVVILHFLLILLIVTAIMKLRERGNLQCLLRPSYKASHALPKARQLVSHSCKQQQDLLHTISSRNVYLQR